MDLQRGMRIRADVCGERWPRIMTVREASIYAGYTSAAAFTKVPRFSEIIRQVPGMFLASVDRMELDAVITAWREEIAGKEGKDKLKVKERNEHE